VELHKSKDKDSKSEKANLFGMKKSDTDIDKRALLE